MKSLERRPWMIEVKPIQQDNAIKLIIEQIGLKNWTKVSHLLKLRFGIKGRQFLLSSGKQCRERWHNHLDPKIHSSHWTIQQEVQLFEYHKTLGNQWSQIAKLLPGRTDNSIKNHFYSTVRLNLRNYIKKHPNCGYFDSCIQQALQNPQLAPILLVPNRNVTSRKPLQPPLPTRKSTRIKKIMSYRGFISSSSSESEAAVDGIINEESNLFYSLSNKNYNLKPIPIYRPLPKKQTEFKEASPPSSLTQSTFIIPTPTQTPLVFPSQDIKLNWEGTLQFKDQDQNSIENILLSKSFKLLNPNNHK